MALTDYTLYLTSAGAPAAGLTPTWLAFVNLHTSTILAPSPITPQPVVTPMGTGLYRITYDPAVAGEAIGVLDCGVLVAAVSERYVPVVLIIKP